MRGRSARGDRLELLRKLLQRPPGRDLLLELQAARAVRAASRCRMWLGARPATVLARPANRYSRPCGTSNGASFCSVRRGSDSRHAAYAADL